MAMERKAYCEILGVSHDATQDEVKRKWRSLVKELHPDLHSGNKALEDRLKAVNVAHEILSDPVKRQKYDVHEGKRMMPDKGPFIWTDVQSTAISRIGYDLQRKILRVIFKNTGATYEYSGVPLALYQALLAAPSKGKFFHYEVAMKFDSRHVAG